MRRSDKWRNARLPVSDTVRASRLHFFGHIARAQSTEDHRRVVWAAMQKPPLSWSDPREGQAWLGYEWSRTTSNQWTLAFTPPGGKQMTVRNGVASWAQQRSSRSRLWRERERERESIRVVRSWSSGILQTCPNSCSFLLCELYPSRSHLVVELSCKRTLDATQVIANVRNVTALLFGPILYCCPPNRSFWWIYRWYHQSLLITNPNIQNRWHPTGDKLWWWWYKCVYFCCMF